MAQQDLEKIVNDGTTKLKTLLKTDASNALLKGKLLLKIRDCFEGPTAFQTWRAETFGDDLQQKTIYHLMYVAEVFSEGLPNKVPLTGCYILARPGNRNHLNVALTELNKIVGPIQVKDVENIIAIAKGQDHRRPVLQTNHHIKINEDAYLQLNELKDYFDLPTNSAAALECIQEMHAFYISNGED